MTDLRKAAEMAYEVMTDIDQVCEGANHKRKDMHPYGGECPIQKRFDDAWEALRQALAQPEQEPYGWISNEDGWFRKHEIADLSFKTEAMPLYTAPPKREWVGLSDVDKVNLCGMILGGRFLECIDATEAKLKEKNT